MDVDGRYQTIEFRILMGICTGRFLRVTYITK